MARGDGRRHSSKGAARKERRTIDPARANHVRAREGRQLGNAARYPSSCGECARRRSRRRSTGKRRCAIPPDISGSRDGRRHRDERARVLGRRFRSPPEYAEYRPRLGDAPIVRRSSSRFRRDPSPLAAKGQNESRRRRPGLTLAGDEGVEIEGQGRTAGLTLDQRCAQGREPRLLLLEQAQARADDVARAGIATLPDLLLDKGAEVIPDAEGRVPAHGPSSCRLVPKFGISRNHSPAAVIAEGWAGTRGRPCV